ncbi:PAS fold [Nesidiocoris tenuis]|uniref:PAS fold n=1 Tax=Nesidiocoris tenuis TaxID=355587 RepID=A0ABN7B7X3_9HEMI|nr:PAS fold [Nesidiocoris tenuis]
MRNQAEKQRRDKLNQFINELAMLVPMVASSAKRLDKTSVLRLSATFLRMHQILNKNREKQTQQKQLSVPINWCQHMLEVRFFGEL